MSIDFKELQDQLPLTCRLYGGGVAHIKEFTTHSYYPVVGKVNGSLLSWSQFGKFDYNQPIHNLNIVSVIDENAEDTKDTKDTRSFAEKELAAEFVKILLASGAAWRRGQRDPVERAYQLVDDLEKGK